MKETKQLKIISITLLIIMLLQVILPVVPLNTISNAEEPEITGSGTEADPWLIGKENPSDVTAYMEATTLYINGTGDMMDFEDTSDRPWDKESRKFYITEVVISNTITSIGARAFSGCSGLTSITIPNSVTSIGYDAFCYCYNLTEIVVDVNNTNYTSENGILFNKDKTILIKYPEGKEETSYAIPNSVTNIGDNAFLLCSDLTSITIPNSVTSIGDNAFYNCLDLTSITIPNSVTSIGNFAFYNCIRLTEIVVDVNNANYSSENGVLFNKNKTKLINYPRQKEGTSYQVPNTVEIIDEYAFHYCEKLTDIVIPEGVTSIGDSAFESCSGLTSIEIPNSVTSIGGSAFYSCSGLTNITIPNSVTSIGDHAFCYCYDLTSITIPNGVTSIGDYAFHSCPGLTSITIPNSVTSIGYDAFCYCYNLTEIVVDVNNTNYTSENGILFNKDRTTLIKYPEGKEGTSYIIPNGVTSIGDFAFYRCSGLTSIEIPNSVTSIGDYAFYRCSGLTSIEIPNSVTSIGGSAFESCSGLTNITIPNGVTSIGARAFCGCSGLTNIVILSNNLVELETYFVFNTDAERESKTKVYYNADTNAAKMIKRYIEMNRLDTATSEFIPATWNISATLNDNVTAKIVVDDNTDDVILQITGTGAMKDYMFTSNDSPWYDAYHNLITKVEIGEGITNIGNYAFIAHTNIKSVTIPSSVTSIGTSAFMTCRNLEDISIPSNLTTIGDHAFAGCAKIESLTVPETVTSVGTHAFNTARPGKTDVYYYPECTAMVNHIAEYGEDANFVEIEETREIEGISLDTTDVKKEYKVGETFDLTGLKVTKTYSDGTTEVVTSNFTTENGFTFDPAEGSVFTSSNNAQQIYVVYRENGKRVGAHFAVKVIGIKNIELDTSNVKVNYVVGENLNLRGLVVTAIYTDNSEETVTDYQSNPANGTALTTAGTQVVAITYGETRATFNIEVIEKTTPDKEVKSISIKARPKTSYNVGEKLDLSGLVITVTYTDNTTEDITSGYTSNPINGTTLTTAGTQRVTISYSGKTASFNITVKGEETEEDILIEESTYEINESYLENVGLNTRIRTFLSNFNSVYTVTVSDENTEYIGTGMTATVKKQDGTTVCTLEVVIMGDVTGDGIANISDIFEVNKARLNTLTFSGAKAKAADLNGDSIINILDIFEVNKLRSF